MSLDGFSMRFLARELDSILAGGRDVKHKLRCHLLDFV